MSIDPREPEVPVTRTAAARLRAWREARANRGRGLPVQDRIVTVPNALTLLRLLSLPVFVYLVARDMWLQAAALLFAMAVSDVLDGQLARRLNQVSRLGTALDPVADRLTVITVAVTLLLAGVAPAILVILIVIRDLFIAVLVVIVFRRRLPIPVTGTAKLATAGLLFGIPLLVLSHASMPGAVAIRIFAIIVIAVGTALYYLALVQYLAAGLRSRRDDR